MSNLKWLIAPKEMAELERWHAEWHQHRRWFAEFPVAAASLDRLYDKVNGVDTTDMMRLRDSFRPAAPTAFSICTTTVLIGQIKVMAELLQASVGVLRTVDPESTEERELLQTLIDQSEAAIATVLTEHAMPKAAGEAPHG